MNHIYNILLLNLLAIIWSLTFILTEIALIDVTPLSLVYLRVTIGAITLYIIIRLMGLHLSSSWHVWKYYILLGLFNNVIPFSAIFTGQLYINASLASILNGTTPILTAIIAHIATKDEKITLYSFIGIILAFIGIIWVIDPKHILEPSHSDYGFYGQLLILCAALSYGVSAVIGKKLKNEHSFSVATGMLLCASFTLAPIAFLYDDIILLRPSFHSWVAIFIFGMLCSAVAYMLYFIILKRAGAVYLSLVTILVPVFTSFIAYFYLDERLQQNHIIGLLFIFTGIFIYNSKYLHIKNWWGQNE